MSELAIEAIVADRDYALKSFVGMSHALGAALDRLNETGDEEGVALVRGVFSEYFDQEGLIQ